MLDAMLQDLAIGKGLILSEAMVTAWCRTPGATVAKRPSTVSNIGPTKDVSANTGRFLSI